MLLLILFVLFYIFVEQKSIEISASGLTQSYSLNIKEADKKFLNKQLDLTGKVKSYIQFGDANSILELATDDKELNLYCILVSKDISEKASTFTSGTKVTIYGKCLGLNPHKSVKYLSGIYIETENIK